jgi:hypothetical protein
MARSTRRWLSALLLIGSQGCVTGHLLDATRRYERPAVYHEAALDDGRLLFTYSAIVTDQFGERVGEAPERRVAIPLADLGREVRADAIHVDRLSAAGLHGRPVPVLVDGASCRNREPPAVAIEETPEGETDLVLCTVSGPLGRVPCTALVQTTTPPWVYVLLPFTVALDAVSDPVLLLFAPAVILTGD